MAPMKRKGNFAGRAAKKGRYSKLVPTVVDALAHSETLPASLRTLLKTTLPIVMAANKVDRHAYEAEVVDQAQRALGQVQAAIEQEHKVSLGKQNEVIAPAENAKREAAKKAAEAHLEAVKNKLEAEKVAKKAAEKAEEDAEDALKAAQKEEKVAQKEHAKVHDKKETLSNSLSHDFVMLREGTGAGAEGKKAVHKLMALGKEYGVDSTLLSTLPIASKKQPAGRTDFENMVFTNLQALIAAQIDNLSHHVAEAENVAAGKAATTAGASAALEQAKAVLKAAEEALEATHVAHKEAGKDVAKADKHLRQIWEDMMHVCDAQDKLANDLKHFAEVVWVAFNQLKEKEPEPEPVEEPPAPEEAAPAEAAPVEAAAPAQ